MEGKTAVPEAEQEPNNSNVSLPTEEARQGETLGHMRYVLAISLALALIAFAVLYFIYIA